MARLKVRQGFRSVQGSLSLPEPDTNVRGTAAVALAPRLSEKQSRAT